MDAVKAAAHDGKVTCVAAYDIADQLSVLPEEVGQAIDLCVVKIAKCQLGLFGYGKGVKLVKPAESVPEELEREIRLKLADGRITCRDLWVIADRRNLPRLKAAGACEKLGIKISACQLGAF
jgi:hypothetical protein